MKEIPLTKNKVAIVDDSDFDWLNQWPWLACFVRSASGGIWYALSGGPYRGVTDKSVLMHRFIMDDPGELDVDHRNRNGLDNRRANLRVATTSQNAANSHRIKAESGFKGVYPGRMSGWRARICVDGVRMCLGSYKTREEAATAYGLAAIMFFGEFARMSCADWIDDQQKLADYF